MHIERKDIDTLNAQLVLKLESSDYSAKFEDELQKQGKKVSLKGFRKGKVPKTYLKKVLGKSVLAEVVLGEVNKTLSEYVEKEGLKLLGGPIASEEQEDMDFDPNNLTDYSFQFDIGFEPEFDVSGVDEKSTYEKVVVEVTDDMVTEELDKARTRLGKEVEVEKDIEDNDRVEIQAFELENGKRKEGGHEAEIKLLVNMVVDKTALKALKGGMVGDNFDFDPFKLEKEASDHHVKKHILGLESDEVEVSNEWRGEITKAIRIAPADLDQDFFKKYFGEENDSEEKARELLSNDIAGFYNRQSEALLFRSFQDKLLSDNNFEMPEAFMRKWLDAQGAEDNKESMTDEAFENFIKGLRWTLIRDKVGEQGEVEVDAKEIQDYFMAQIRQYMGPYGADENLLMHSVQRLMQDNEQVRKAYETIKDDKVFQYIASNVKTKEKKVSVDQLNKMIEAVRQG